MKLRGGGKILSGEDKRDSGSVMKCLLLWIYIGSVPTRGYMNWMT